MNSFAAGSTAIVVQSGDLTYLGRTALELRALGVPEVDILAGVKTKLREMIDAEAERRRSTVATPGAGQAMEYQQAQVEAFDALASAGPPDAAAYPMLAASIGIDVDPQTGDPAADVLGVARSVKAAFAAWLAFGAAVRRARLVTKAAIDAATTIEAAAAAAAAAVWPSLT